MKRKAALEARASRGEETYRREKETLDATIAEKGAVADSIAARLAELRDPSDLERRRSNAQAKAAQLRLDIAENTASVEKDRSALHEVIIDMLGEATEHKEWISSTINLVVEMAEEARNIQESSSHVVAI